LSVRGENSGLAVSVEEVMVAAVDGKFSRTGADSGIVLSTTTLSLGNGRMVACPRVKLPIGVQKRRRGENCLERSFQWRKCHLRFSLIADPGIRDSAVLGYTAFYQPSLTAEEYIFDESTLKR
jgi:hypothetical protein